MAKSTKIHEQDQALSVYFKDMLGEHAEAPATKIEDTPAHQIQTQPVAETVPQQTEQPSTASEEVTINEAELTGDIKLLLCKVAGMDVAVPVDSLDNIVRWPTEKPITKIPGKASWDLGIYSHHGSHTEVIDITHILSPDSASASPQQTDYILLVANHKWGIACEQIRQIITLPKNQINWRRKDRQQRPWFSGIVNEHMSSVLDIDVLLAAIQK